MLQEFMEPIGKGCLLDRQHLESSSLHASTTSFKDATRWRSSLILRGLLLQGTVGFITLYSSFFLLKMSLLLVNILDLTNTC